MWKLINRCIWIFQKSVVGCTTLSTSISDNNLPDKKRKVTEKENNLPNNKRKYSSRKRINNESDKDHPTNKWKTIKRISNKERKDSPSLKRSINLNITYKK